MSMTKATFNKVAKSEISQLMTMAFAVSTQTKHDVSINYSGSCGLLDVTIYYNGYISDDDKYLQWLDYKEKQKKAGKRWSCYEKYIEHYTIESHMFFLGNRVQSDLTKISQLSAKLDLLIEER